MIQTGFESRIKVQNIIESQLPEFILDESPKASEFLKQYYISQEYQGGPVDIAENLDQYLKVDNLTPEVIVGSVGLTTNITASSGIVTVTSTKGFPQKYGLLQIDDEIITYTGITTNTFTGCIRGFSGITNYHKELNYEELVFSKEKASNHSSNSRVKNLSSLFLQEFYKKLKYTLTPGLENLDFVPDLNVGNFIKEARTFYESKGTSESFRILFNILFGETPRVVDLEQFLLKSSYASYIRREVVIAEAISGNPLNLSGQTIVKKDDERSTASVSEVEIITRKNKTYYKLLLFIGYDDAFPTITGTFDITSTTRNLIEVSPGNNVISVDSTVGFPTSGKIYSGTNAITYQSKSVNEFFGCSGVNTAIPRASTIYGENTYFGYEDGDTSKKVEIRLTGVLSGFESVTQTSPISVGEKISVKNVGEIINNPQTNPSYKEIFANSWIYNTSSRYQIDTFPSGTGAISQFTVKSSIDKSSLKVGDYIDIVSRDSQNIVVSNLQVRTISGKQVSTNNSFTLNRSLNYDIIRKINTASSSSIPLEFNRLISDVQNVYNENDKWMYVASNSLPSYQITRSLVSYNASRLGGYDDIERVYSKIIFTGYQELNFRDGSEIYYSPSDTPITGLSEGIYYVENVELDDNVNNLPTYAIRLYISRNLIGTGDYLKFTDFTPGIHNFRLSSQKSGIISPQKILRKFPLVKNIASDTPELTEPGTVGMLINGVEIMHYKSSDKIYYGPLETVNVLGGGKNYDVINPPEISVSQGNAKIQPIVEGSVEKIYLSPQNFDINVTVSIALTGGNGKGASFRPVFERKRRELEFDARDIGIGGGVDIDNETISFTSEHNLVDGEPIIYRPGNAPLLGIGTFKGNNFNTGKTLEKEVTYYAKYVNNITVQLYQSFSDYLSGINTVGFTSIGTYGLQKFVTSPKNILKEIKVVDGGTGYQNRKLRVLPIGVSTSSNSIFFTNHGFNSGELVTYDYQTAGISGLSTTNQYYVIKIDDNSFRLSDAGIGGTNVVNYERGKYVSFGSTGSGYQIFNYPEISLSINYTNVGLGSTQTTGKIDATPVVRGKIIDTYVYEKGSDYGSTIINQHVKPKILIKTGKNAQLRPILLNGTIKEVSVQFGGSEYYSTPEIKVKGSGTGAILKPIVVNNRISRVVVINPGIGYSTSDTSIVVEPSGKNAVLDPQVRSLTINTAFLYADNFVSSTISQASEVINSFNAEIIRNSYNNLQYTVASYFQNLQTIFNDTNTSSHSPIIGWAYDGNPIYGSRGYSTPSNKNSAIRRLTPGYTVNLDNVYNRPSTSIYPQGTFIEDYTFTNSGDLDEYNGRFCITPEFPNGTYAYFSPVVVGQNGNLEGVFPYFVGNKYKSKFIEENKFLNQSFDFNNSNLVRNTFPYKVNDQYANNDFIIESNEINNQFTVIESVTSDFIEDFDIINSGDEYKIGDTLNFDESSSGGGGLIAQVSQLKGKNIVRLQTTSKNYDNAIFTRKNNKQIKITITPNHDLQDSDYVNISGFSTSLSSLNGFYQIGVTSYTSTLLADIPTYASSGIVTDIYIANIPKEVSIGSSIKVENEIFKVLNVFNPLNIIRVSRETTGTAHTATTTAYFIPDSFTINKSSSDFDSKINNTVYFNPTLSVGVGTTPGIGIAVTYPFGTTSRVISIPTQSIYLPNHPFKTNQAVTLVKPTSTSSISVANTSGSSAFNLPASGNSQTVYIINKSVDFIGIVTQVGLTTTTNGLYFRSNGTSNFLYSLTSNYTQKKADIKKIVSTVYTDSQHGLTNGDKINLVVKPNLNVGIGTSTNVGIKYDSSRKKILINQKTFTSSGINTTTNSITISNHGFNSGDKVFYNATTVASGLTTGFYFIFKINNNSFNLCETFKDSTTYPPLVVDILSTTSTNNQLSLVNPQINSVKNNNLTFDLSDSSLSGYNFKLFYDEKFENEFVSTAKTSGFTVVKSGTIGSANAKVVINHNNDINLPLYYTLEKFGNIISADKDVKNYNKINFINSYYNGSYKVSGVGTTSFEISLKYDPESLSYNQTNCDVLEYKTKSISASGGVSDIEIISPGYGFEKLPIFTKINSTNGKNAYIIPKSNNVGKISQFKILNEGFEYSSDKTLKPEALIPQSLTLKNFSEIDNISIIDGGKNYLTPPDLILVNSTTNQKIDSGYIKPRIEDGVIRTISIIENPKGLPEATVNIFAINNTNGVGIQSAIASSSGIVTCTLITPLFGFTEEPFAVGDKIFVEGIRKSGTSGDGFNSENYGYKIFTISDYINGGSILPRKVVFNLSELTTNPGIVSSSQDYSATIINYKNYPKFRVIQKLSSFNVGEDLEVKLSSGFSRQNLNVSFIEKNYIKVSGTYDLQKNNIIRGTDSGTIATIDAVNKSSGRFKIGYGSTQRIGWFDNIGQLNDDLQVIPDNDYYQNLSYTVKSSQIWEKIVSPVNNLVHISGLKNFADTEIINNTNSGVTTTKNYSFSRYDIINENRVDTINNFDLSQDVDVDRINNISKYIKFKNKKIADYIECRTNRVLEIDDISDQFFTDGPPVTKIVGINSSLQYEKYLVQITNNDYSQIQFEELSVLISNNDIFTFEKSTISNQNYEIADIYGEYTETDGLHLKFSPTDQYNQKYNIKYLNTSPKSNINTLGIGTTSFGFANLTGYQSTVSAGSSATFFTATDLDSVESVYAEIDIINNITKEMNYIEFYVVHDDTNVYSSDFYFDTSDDGRTQSSFIGTVGASITGGILKLDYKNTSSQPVTLRTKVVGFGSTASGIGTYRFKSAEQTDGTEKTVKFESLYSNVSSASTVISFDTQQFTSVKSTIKVGVGTTSALHQIMTIVDPSNIYTLQYPFLSVGSTSGIGTFGGEINGTTASLKFYPDPDFSTNLEILSFNQIFYSENETENYPPDLEYGNIVESVGFSTFTGLNLRIKDEKLNFTLKYNGTPIFMKKFNPANSSVLDLSTGIFFIRNHFFNTGEELIYRPTSTLSNITALPMGIGSTANYVGVVTNTLPTTVYAIRIDNDNFKLSTRREYALANPAIAVTFTSVGAGNVHELEMKKKNEKAIICINNIIQSPVAYVRSAYSVNNYQSVGAATTIFGLSGISSIKPNDILKIDNEFMKVLNVGYGASTAGPISSGGTFAIVQVKRGFLGTANTVHTNSTNISLYRGSYNIVKSDIYFTDAPRGIVDNPALNQSNLPDLKDYFNGRVFLRKDYTTNKIYDDVSDDFTGIGQTYILKNNGINTVGTGVSSGSGIILINGIFQTPLTPNNVISNYSIVENNSSGISSVIFSGNNTSSISNSDVNTNELPRGGLIVSLGSTPGLGYAPLVGASVTAILGAGGSITSVGIGTTGNWGSGYRGTVSIAVTEVGHSGVAATITATVGAGGSLSFNIIGGGTNYTNPQINIPSPTYENLSVIGVSRLGIGATTKTGVGLLLNVDVGPASTTGIGSTLFEVTQFKIIRSGYGFKRGDVLKLVGLVTAYGLSSPLDDFELTVIDTFNDSFSSWEFGQLDYIDSIKSYQDGSRVRFPLYYNSQLISFEKNPSDPESQLIDFNSLLIIFVNNVLQQPRVSYSFEGGTSFLFSEPPRKEDKIDIFFYRGSELDSKIVNINETIKIGDTVQIYSNNNLLGVTTTQEKRIITGISSSSTVETNLYPLQGIDEINYKPLYWTKQKVDKIIKGDIVSKSRDSIEPQVYPTAKIIKNFSSTDTELFVDDAQFFNYENDASIIFNAFIVSGKENPVSAAVTAIVSSAGTIQSLVISNAGSGYTGSSVNIKIASPPVSIVGFGTTLSVGLGTTAIASISVVNGSLSTVTISNPGSGYTFTNPPQIIVPLPKPIYENISNIQGTNLEGFSGNIIGIETSSGIGTNLAITFTLDASLSPFTGLSTNYYVYISNTSVGRGVTSIINTNSSVVGVGTTFLDNIYYINGFDSTTGIITCNIHSQSSIVGIATTGNIVGKISWGRFSGFTRSSSPISIAVSGYSVDSGLSTFPTIQRRGYGLRDIGPIKKTL